jgi:hypothetical protein
MIEPMRGDFVTMPHDISDEPRVPLGDPAEHKEGGANPPRRQNIQQPMHIPLYPAFAVIPLTPAHMRGKSRNLKMFFHVK